MISVYLFLSPIRICPQDRPRLPQLLTRPRVQPLPIQLPRTRTPLRRPLPRSPAPSASPIHPANSVVASAALLGTGDVAMSVTQTLSTRGSTASRSAKVSSRLECDFMCTRVSQMMATTSFVSLTSVNYMYPQARPLPRSPAPSVAPQRLDKVVVASVAVLGSGNVAISVTQNLITRGSTASRPAKVSSRLKCDFMCTRVSQMMTNVYECMYIYRIPREYHEDCRSDD